MHRRVGEETRQVGRACWIAILGRPEPTDTLRLLAEVSSDGRQAHKEGEADHVQDADIAHNSPEELWMAISASTDQESAVRAAIDGCLRRSSQSLLVQVPRSVFHILETNMSVQAARAVVPRFAVFASPADVGHGDAEDINKCP